MEYLTGTANIGELLNEFPACREVFEELGIEIQDSFSLVETASRVRLPLPLILNALAKKLDREVGWPKVSGAIFNQQDTFSPALRLRSGKPQGVKKILAIHSGKGGVGKTFLTSLLAIFIEKAGKRVAILDLDIDCPNLSKVFKVSEKLLAGPNQTILPVSRGNMQFVSMGNILGGDNQPILWRGPIMAKAIEQLVFDTAWNEVDLLLVDLPPGTSDVPLTLLNMCKPDGAMLVTTAQETALMDTAKSLEMFKKFQVPIVGVVENMAGDIFGKGKAEIYFEDQEVLGQIPLKTAYQELENDVILKDPELNGFFDKLKMTSFYNSILLN